MDIFPPASRSPLVAAYRLGFLPYQAMASIADATLGPLGGYDPASIERVLVECEACLALLAQDIAASEAGYLGELHRRLQQKVNDPEFLNEADALLCMCNQQAKQIAQSEAWRPDHPYVTAFVALHPHVPDGWITRTFQGTTRDVSSKRANVPLQWEMATVLSRARARHELVADAGCLDLVAAIAGLGANIRPLWRRLVDRGRWLGRMYWAAACPLPEELQRIRSAVHDAGEDFLPHMTSRKLGTLLKQFETQQRSGSSAANAPSHLPASSNTPVPEMERQGRRKRSKRQTGDGSSRMGLNLSEAHDWPHFLERWCLKRQRRYERWLARLVAGPILHGPAEYGIKPDSGEAAVLLALRRLEALDVNSRAAGPKVKTTAGYSVIAPMVARLIQQGLVESRTGRSGGYWLTATGQQAARVLAERPDISS